MDEKTFVYWLQGFVEIADSDTISEKQWLIIKDHLKLVFDKVTPLRTPDRGVTVQPPNITYTGPKLSDIDWGKLQSTRIIC